MGMTPNLDGDVDLLNWAGRSLRLETAIPLATLGRLDMDRTKASGKVRVLLIGRAESAGSVPTIEGQIETSVPRICQRCLAPMDEVLKCKFTWYLARHEVEYQRLDEQYESVLLCDTSLNLKTLIEDELILNQALSPLHDSVDECDRESVLKYCEFEDDRSNAKKSNPFAVLKDLKSSH